MIARYARPDHGPLGGKNHSHKDLRSKSVMIDARSAFAAGRSPVS
jgi:hypothetical protein